MTREERIEILAKELLRLGIALRDPKHEESADLSAEDNARWLAESLLDTFEKEHSRPLDVSDLGDVL